MQMKNKLLTKQPKPNSKSTTTPNYYQSSFNLNSYKVDSQIYKHKLQELKSQKDSQQHQIFKIKQNQNSLNNKLESLINENTMLKSIINKRQSSNHSSCQFKLKQKSRELQIKKLQAVKYKKMYEAELQNKRKVQQFYQKQLRQIKNDQKTLIEKYQQKIHTLSIQLSNLVSSPKKQNKIQSFQQKVKPSIQVVINEAQILEKFIKGVSQKIVELQIGLNQLLSIPIFKLLNQNQNIVSKKQFCQALSQFPFQVKKTQEKNKIYKNLYKEVVKRLGKFTGQNIINYMQIQLYELLSEEEGIYNGYNYNPESQLQHLQFSKGSMNSAKFSPTYGEQSSINF